MITTHDNFYYALLSLLRAAAAASLSTLWIINSGGYIIVVYAVALFITPWQRTQRVAGGGTAHLQHRGHLPSVVLRTVTWIVSSPTAV